MYPTQNQGATLNENYQVQTILSFKYPMFSRGAAFGSETSDLISPVLHFPLFGDGVDRGVADR